MSPEHAVWLLEHPLDTVSDDPHALAAYRQYQPQPDGSLLTMILAVDR